MNGSRDISARYAMRRGAFALDVDVTIPMHGVTGVFGESGAGKTSLLRCIAGLEEPDVGKLIVGGETWQDENTSLAVHERDIGYVFQEPRLFPHLDVRANLEYGQRRSRRGGIALHEAVELLGLGRMLERPVTSLSGGEAQRVAMARALLRGPRFVLMDEPLASLDRPRREEILPFLDRLHLQRKIPIVYVSHSIDEIARLCDHLLVMHDGSVAASGPLETVLLQPDLPGLGGAEAGAVIAARVAAVDEQHELTSARFDGGELWVSGLREPGDSLRLRIRASDVSICRSRPEATTILNVIPATVSDIVSESGASALVRLSLGGCEILARVTRRSISELGLARGEEVFAQIKSVALRNTPIDPQVES
jgi:molybdate transport system ATP-binding protein